MTVFPGGDCKVHQMRYWWVNHKKTSQHELKGGYLWSPVCEANGAKSRFYDNMRIASPGDAIISFAHAQIKNIGIVVDFAVSAPKPLIFDSAGESWSNDGWILPVSWGELATPVIPKARLAEFSRFLPAKYSPINPVTGNGNQKAYLAEIGQKVFEVLMGFGGESVESLLGDIGAPSFILGELDKAAEQAVREDMSLSLTTRQQVVAARRGQGSFKRQIYSFESACRLTKLNTPSLLIASHIKPWRLCNTAAERLDGANGLLLAPHVDFLFDRGFISFLDSGAVVFSPRLAVADLKRLGLFKSVGYMSGVFHPRQAEYLAFHRTRVFLK